MKISLLKGEFSAKDTLELITKMIHIKIKYHESKIALNSSEEDIKYRESKIKSLQKDLYELRNNLGNEDGHIALDAEIVITKRNHQSTKK